MGQYRYILLDLDGTLIYSHIGIFACFRYALRKMGRGEASDEQLYPCIGPSLFYSFTHFFGMNEEEGERAVALYRERYAVKGVWENSPVEGALEEMKKWREKGYILALATSKPALFAREIVEKHRFLDCLQEVVGSGMDGSLPTKASVIEEAMKRLGATPAECLMVGDRRYDAEGAKELGVDCALLRVGGYATEEELQACGAKFVLDDFAALTKVLFHV